MRDEPAHRSKPGGLNLAPRRPTLACLPAWSCDRTLYCNINAGRPFWWLPGPSGLNCKRTSRRKRARPSGRYLDARLTILKTRENMRKWLALAVLGVGNGMPCYLWALPCFPLFLALLGFASGGGGGGGASSPPPSSPAASPPSSSSPIRCITCCGCGLGCFFGGC